MSTRRHLAYMVGSYGKAYKEKQIDALLMLIFVVTKMSICSSHVIVNEPWINFGIIHYTQLSIKVAMDGTCLVNASLPTMHRPPLKA
ncbi:hypothetical protein L6452_28730 [Arctium lappa]|uniref:Uncharacterized protein n=1 Tax=Arctium lappa TaxID=4217 RepID=A0ACB8ZZR2_ARCLA|nr:hypothetical protein L6452_28730 [Arctium lappa]